LLAKEIDADSLIILTAVEKVAVNFGKPDVKWLDSLTVEEAKKYIEEVNLHQDLCFQKSSSFRFVLQGKRTAIITLLSKVT